MSTYYVVNSLSVQDLGYAGIAKEVYEPNNFCYATTSGGTAEDFITLSQSDYLILTSNSPSVKIYGDIYSSQTQDVVIEGTGTLDVTSTFTYTPSVTGVFSRFFDGMNITIGNTVFNINNVNNHVEKVSDSLLAVTSLDESSGELSFSFTIPAQKTGDLILKNFRVQSGYTGTISFSETVIGTSLSATPRLICANSSIKIQFPVLEIATSGVTTNLAISGAPATYDGLEYIKLINIPSASQLYTVSGTVDLDFSYGNDSLANALIGAGPFYIEAPKTILTCTIVDVGANYVTVRVPNIQSIQYDEVIEDSTVIDALYGVSPTSFINYEESGYAGNWSVKYGTLAWETLINDTSLGYSSIGETILISYPTYPTVFTSGAVIDNPVCSYNGFIWINKSTLGSQILFNRYGRGDTAFGFPTSGANPTIIESTDIKNTGLSFKSGILQIENGQFVISGSDLYVDCTPGSVYWNSKNNIAPLIDDDYDLISYSPSVSGRTHRIDFDNIENNSFINFGSLKFDTLYKTNTKNIPFNNLTITNGSDFSEQILNDGTTDSTPIILKCKGGEIVFPSDAISGAGDLEIYNDSTIKIPANTSGDWFSKLPTFNNYTQFSNVAVTVSGVFKTNQLCKLGIGSEMNLINDSSDFSLRPFYFKEINWEGTVDDLIYIHGNGGSRSIMLGSPLFNRSTNYKVNPEVKNVEFYNVDIPAISGASGYFPVTTNISASDTLDTFDSSFDTCTGNHLEHIFIKNENLNLVTYFNFDQISATNILDYSDMQNNCIGTAFDTTATPTFNIVSGADISLSAISLSAVSNQVIWVKNKYQFDNKTMTDFSFTLWEQRSDYAATKYILISKGDFKLYTLGNASNYTYTVEVDGIPQTTVNTYSNDVWNFVAVTYNKSTEIIKIYVNGKLDKTYSSPISTPLEYDNKNLIIGGSYTTDATVLTDGYTSNNGKISEVKIFNKELTALEIMTMSNKYDRNNMQAKYYYRSDTLI